MRITASTLSAEAVRAYVTQRKEEEAAERQTHEAAAKAEREKLHQAFLQQEVAPDALERVATLIRKALDRGERQVLVFQLPSEWLPDQGRAITNHDKAWPEMLDGFAKRAYDFFKRELEPRGFQVHAEILSWPDGKPGDVGFFLQWKWSEEL